MKRSFKILRMKSWSHEVTPGYLGDPCLLYSKTLLEGTCCPNVMTTEQQMGVHWPWLCGARTGACETQAWQKPRSQCGRWMSHQWLHWCFWHFKRFTLCLKFHQFYINFLLEISTSKVLRVTFTCLWKKVSMWMNLHCLHLFTHFWLTCCFSFIVTFLVGGGAIYGLQCVHALMKGRRPELFVVGSSGATRLESCWWRRHQAGWDWVQKKTNRTKSSSRNVVGKEVKGKVCLLVNYLVCGHRPPISSTPPASKAVLRPWPWPRGSWENLC